MVFCWDLSLTFEKEGFLNHCYRYLEVEDKCLLKSFELNFSYFEHQMHDLMLQSSKKYILDSIYLIFDYKVSIGIFMETDNKVYQLLYLHSRRCVAKL